MNMRGEADDNGHASSFGDDAGDLGECGRRDDASPDSGQGTAPSEHEGPTWSFITPPTPTQPQGPRELTRRNSLRAPLDEATGRRVGGRTLVAGAVLAIGIAAVVIAALDPFGSIGGSRPGQVPGGVPQALATPRIAEESAGVPVPAPDRCASTMPDPTMSAAQDGGMDAPIADVDGDGCADPISVRAGIIEVDTGTEQVVFEVGEETDQILIGDWNCDGVATPLLYRPATGAIYEYDRWPQAGEPARPSVSSGPLGGQAGTQANGDCDEVVIDSTS